jgi:hypothetical protein
MIETGYYEKARRSWRVSQSPEDLSTWRSSGMESDVSSGLKNERPSMLFEDEAKCLGNE